MIFKPFPKNLRTSVIFFFCNAYLRLKVYEAQGDNLRGSKCGIITSDQ